jgi:hypothetical protein
MAVNFGKITIIIRKSSTAHRLTRGCLRGDATGMLTYNAY